MNSSPLAREVGKWSYVLRLLHAALPARFSPAQEIPSQLGCQRQLPHLPSEQGLLWMDKIESFCKIKFRPRREVPLLPQSEIIRNPT